jgi:hypothetical protein
MARWVSSNHAKEAYGDNDAAIRNRSHMNATDFWKLLIQPHQFLVFALPGRNWYCNQYHILAAASKITAFNVSGCVKVIHGNEA